MGIGLNFKDYTIEKIFMDIFPDEKKRFYILELLATCLSDEIPNFNLHFLAGNGCNGETIFFKILKMVFGKL